MKKTTAGQGISLVAAMAVLILLLSAVAWAGGPEGVSPSAGSTGQDVAVITNPCPTFSWSGVDGASGYRVEVYEMVTIGVPSHNDMAAISQPVISRDAQKALSYTPAQGECLTVGKRYVWYVGSQRTDGRGQTTVTDWSEGRVFEVSSALSVEAQTEVKETVKNYLTTDWKKTDSYQHSRKRLRRI